MKIVLDNIIFALQNHGGISVVWYELASRLLTSGLDLHFTNSSQDVANPLGRMLHIDGQRRMNDRSPLYQKLIRYRDERIKEDGKFIFHSSYYRICDNPHAINITTVHDFTYELYNHGLKRAVHSWQKRKAILHSDHIVCISENTKKDLMRFYPEVSPEKVSVVYNGVSADYHPIAPEECTDLHIPYRPHEYVIFIGSRAKYKNFELAVQAVSRSNLNLVVVGACLNEEEKGLIRKYFQDAARVFCTGPIDNRELNVLYNHALALAYPSSYEGFGIPVLEAQKAGCPVIAYNGSSIPEVIGESPLLMNELSADEMLRCLSVLSVSGQRERIVENGFRNSARFSWDNMYAGIMDIYQKAWNLKK